MRETFFFFFLALESEVFNIITKYTKCQDTWLSEILEYNLRNYVKTAFM